MIGCLDLNDTNISRLEHIYVYKQIGFIRDIEYVLCFCYIFPLLSCMIIQEIFHNYNIIYYLF
jgi:hypothetical protein